MKISKYSEDWCGLLQTCQIISEKLVQARQGAYPLSAVIMYMYVLLISVQQNLRIYCVV